MKVQLLIIDPQKDFVGTSRGEPLEGRATLPVKGADDDMKRLAALVKRLRTKLDDVHVTLDSHRVVDAAHPAMWTDRSGRQPKPFTIIPSGDVKNDVWRPRNLADKPRMVKYAETLESTGQYQLMIWPEHCLIGTWGWCVHDSLMAELLEWERQELATVDFVTKGSNPYTEHYGALMAEVPDPLDPGTQLNTRVITALQEADVVGIAGEASSHCVLKTISQVVQNIGDSHLPKLHVITDCTSPVPQTPGGPDFPAIADAFFADMQRRGVRMVQAADFLK